MLDNRAVSRASEIHTNSASMARAIASRWPDAPDVFVIPPGVQLPEAIPLAVERDIDVLFVGNMSVLHNIDAVLYFVREVFPLVRKEIPEELRADRQRLEKSKKEATEV